MKLYYSPGACSLSPHIALREAGLNFELVQVDLATKKTASGQNYLEINPAGYVPCLQLDDGRTLTEGPAILQYVADQVPGKLLAPANGSFERYHLQQWLNFISTELHKSFSPLFNPAASEDWKNAVRQTIAARLGVVATRFEDAPYLLGDSLSVADIYLFVVLGWAAYVNLDLSPWPALQAFMGRVGGREAVQAALRAEGLIKG
ncbi:glutathione transferase GstA [Malikia spinosa]|jgi:glutathione S-transferase|uniref:Glutathione transferase GstA n=1 Tax=Malikia spinosa TaxID=86180 RepID=A0A7C9NEG6_9BURK|nr:glutathione transferase GstA [Malikia spinosa]MYZ50923.1 glutathione transferase GstA [Malikia spinosa]